MSTLRNNWHIIALTTIILFGLALRLYNLTWQCLMVDETVTQEIAARTTIDIIHWALTVDCNPPTYYLIAHWSSIVLGGISYFSIRIPAVIIGTIAIPLSYLVGRQVHGKTLGLLVASMVSFMFPFVFYAQNARAYSLVLCAFLSFTYFWLKLMEGDRRAITIIGCSVFAAACMYAHYFSVIPLLVAILILFWKNHNLAIKISAYAAILFSPLAIISNPWNLVSRAAPEIVPGYMMITPNHEFWITPLQMAIYLPNEMLCWSWLIILPLAGYAVYRYPDAPLKYFLPISIIPGLVLIGLATISNLSPRYAILVSPLLIIAAMYPVADLIDWQTTLAKKTGLFSLAVFIVAVFNYGSLLSWFTFNVCPLVNGINLAIKIVS